MDEERKQSNRGWTYHRLDSSLKERSGGQLMEGQQHRVTMVNRDNDESFHHLHPKTEKESETAKRKGSINKCRPVHSSRKPVTGMMGRLLDPKLTFLPTNRLLKNDDPKVNARAAHHESTSIKFNRILKRAIFTWKSFHNCAIVHFRLQHHIPRLPPPQ